jgi:uncharacterized protein (PEP-CTERM system associated)
MTRSNANRAAHRRTAHRHGLALGLALAAVQGGAASAQLLPHLGAPVELGDLRGAFQRAYGPPGVAIAERPWSITPAIDVDVTATDNAAALGAGARRGGDVVATITPSLFAQANTQRLVGSLYYAPQLRTFMRNSSQNTVAQNLNASAKATIFEDLLFLNASAYATEYSRQGGLGPSSAGRLTKQDRVQSTSYSIGPQLRHSFADYGVLDAGYTFSQINQSGAALRTATPFAPAVAPGNTTTNTLQVSFTSGQEFGRISFTPALQRTMYDGPGVLKNAHRYSETLDLGYAATRVITLLGQIGHQDVRYGGTRPVRVNGAIWNIGVRWNPDPDTTITARYGYRDGGDNFSLEGTAAPTARIRVSALYSEGMADPAEEFQNAIGRTQISASGIAIDPKTGMPVIVVNNFAGAQGGLSRVRRVSLSAVLLQDIDTFTLSFNRDERTTLSGDLPGTAPNTTYNIATVGWQRELWPGVRGNAQASYGERSAGNVGNQETMTFSAGLNWALSETLSTRASYTYTRSSSNLAGFGYEASLVSLGLHKSF